MNIIALCLGTAGFLTLSAGITHADPSQPQHPAYLRALTDLKLAYAAIDNRPGDAAMRPHEQAALDHIHAAEDIIKKAALDDNKNVNYIPSADAHPGKIGELHDAKVFLEKARSDITMPESAQGAKYLQTNALNEVYRAHHSLDLAINDYEQHK